MSEDLRIRQSELVKIDTLEEKIKEELESLSQKTETMKCDLEKFGNVATVKEEFLRKRDQLEKDHSSAKENLSSIQVRLFVVLMDVLQTNPSRSAFRNPLPILEYVKMYFCPLFFYIKYA